MNISAQVINSKGKRSALVQTEGNERAVVIAPRAVGFGSSVNARALRLATPIELIECEIVGWYEAVFGRPPDVIVRDEIESMWNLAQSAWVYIVLDNGRAGTSSLTILVDDLEDHLHGLSSRGIVKWDLESVPGLYRKATLTDPDGNTVAFGQNLSEA